MQKCPKIVDRGKSSFVNQKIVICSQNFVWNDAKHIETRFEAKALQIPGSPPFRARRL
jgi:hypothetical protein